MRAAAIKGTNVGNPARPPSRLHDDLVADRYATRFDPSGESTQVVPLGPSRCPGWTKYALNGKAEGERDAIFAGGCAFQSLQHRRAVVPWHALACIYDIVAVERAYRDARNAREVEARSELHQVCSELIEALRIEADEIHLVDGEQEMRNAQEIREIHMPPRLRQHAIASIDQYNGKVGCRCGGHHVAG